jgi:alpha-mannosidase
VKIAAGGVRILSLRRGAKKSPAPVKTTVRKRAISNDIGIGVTGGVLPRISFARADITLTPQIELIDDPSDTWSHDINRYNGPVVARARWHTPQILDSGPLMASLFLRSEVSRSRLTAEYRVYAGKPWIELRLGVNWQETHKVLKLTFRAKAFGERRIDGILGGSLVRESTGAELPVQNWTLLTFEGGAKLGIVCPDVFALDATRKEVRLTLLRSAMLANHDPHPATYPRGTVADQGMHEFRFRIWAGDQVTPAALEKESVQIQAPPLFADATKGMPCRWSEMK